MCMRYLKKPAQLIRRKYHVNLSHCYSPWKGVMVAVAEWLGPEFVPVGVGSNPAGALPLPLLSL